MVTILDTSCHQVGSRGRYAFAFEVRPAIMVGTTTHDVGDICLTSNCLIRYKLLVVRAPEQLASFAATVPLSVLDSLARGTLTAHGFTACPRVDFSDGSNGRARRPTSDLGAKRTMWNDLRYFLHHVKLACSRILDSHSGPIYM